MAASDETKARVLALLNPQSAPPRPVSRPGAIRRGAKAAGKRQRAREKREDARDGGGGGFLGDVLTAHVGPVSINNTLKVLDYPRRGLVRTSLEGAILADEIIGRDEHADELRGLRGDIMGGRFGGAELLEGLGVDNKYVKGFGGFAIDVATDPLTYAGGAGVLRGGAKAVAGKILTEAPERLAAKYALEAGVSQADNIAMKAIREESQRVAEEAATRVSREGVSSLSNRELRDIMGTRGGVQFTIPGTGRYGRKLTGASRELQVPIVPRTATNLITRPAARARTALRESALGGWAGSKLAGEEGRALLRAGAVSGDVRIAPMAIGALKASQTEQARSAVIFRELLREYGDNVRPQIKKAFDDVVAAAERGDVTGKPLLDFFGTVADTVKKATNGAIDLRRDGNYIPLIETKAGRAARTAGKQTYEGAGGYNPTTKSKLRALFGDSEARIEFEQFAKERYGLTSSYFERHPDKIVPIYLQVLERRVAREMTLQRMAEMGIVKPGHFDVRVLDKANIKLRNKLGNKARQAATRAESAKDRQKRLLAEQAEQSAVIAGKAQAPIAGPAVSAVGPDADLPRLLEDTLVARDFLTGEAAAPFEAMGVRQLRAIAKDQGIKGADRMSKRQIVDLLGAKSSAGELVSTPLAKDAALLKAHDRVAAHAFRGSTDPVEAEKFFDSMEGLVRRSGDEEADSFLRAADDAFRAGDMEQGTIMMEHALSRVHRKALFGTADDIEAQDLLDAFPQLASPRARNALIDGLNQSVDQDTANALDEIDRLREAGDDAAANAIAATLPEEVVRFGELSAVGGIHMEEEAAYRLNELFGTQSLAHMLRPAVDADAMGRELAGARKAIEDADAALLAAANQPHRAPLLREQARQLRERERFLKAASRETNRDMRTLATLEARRAQAEAMYLRESGRSVSLEAQRNALATTKIQRQTADELIRGTHKFVDTFSDRIAPNEIADALARVAKVNTPEGWRGFLRHYDNALNYIKAWQISSPGFHLRNTFGGVFNNFLADIDPGAYRRYWKARAGMGDEAWQEAFKKWREFGSPGQYGSHEVATGLKHESLLARINPLGSKNAYVHTNQQVGAQVEDMLRGSLFMDVYMKTKDADAALDAVYKFHFNYDDLSQFERLGVRRVFPFYTWTRKNFPLQVQTMIERPSKYVWYGHFQDNMRDELGYPENVVPSYYGDLWAIPTGVNAGGGQMYLTPDLPFTRTMTEPIPWEDGKPSLNPILSQMTPLVKTPLERIQQHQYFKDIPLTDRREDAPDAWDRIPGLTGALREVGLIDKKGQIAQDDAYTIEQYVPLLGRLRRLFPSEKKYQDRARTTWLSFLGVPLRTNTKEEQRLERFRQYIGETEERTYRVPKGSK